MKYLLIGDLHFGEQGNSEKFNNQLLDLIEWCTDEFAGKVDKVIQVGDYFHHRNKIDVKTMNYAVVAAKIMSDTFGRDHVYVLGGNHDLYHLERLDVTSLVSIESYVKVIDEITQVGNITLTPWIATPQMWDELINHDGGDYCIGHFELNGFKMNDAYIMESGYSAATLEKKYKRTMSGHYHSSQTKGTVTFLGTPIPITMNEANEEHGVWVFDDETNELEFHVYDDIKILSVPYDQIDELLASGLDPEKTTIRVEYPDDLEDETEIDRISETLLEYNFTASKIKYKGKKAQEILNTEVEAITDVENIDAVVLTYIEDSIDVSGVESELLSSLYKKAISFSKENTGE